MTPYDPSTDSDSLKTATFTSTLADRLKDIRLETMDVGPTYRGANMIVDLLQICDDIQAAVEAVAARLTAAGL